MSLADNTAKEQHPLLKKYIMLASLLIIFSVFFVFLYRIDNKYTAPASQPVNGLLVLSEDELEQNPFRFLVRGWRFYPGRLLTPNDFAGGEPNYYSTYVSVGDDTDFNSNEKGGDYSCGTYELRLVLPDDSKTYGIDMPQVFSAYRLYIGKNERLTIGVPEEDSYRARFANRLISFDHEGSSEVRILIAVSNMSYFYGGMVYAPAFGTPMSLNYIRGIKLGISLVFLSVMVITSILCIIYGTRQKQRDTLLIAMLFIVVIVYTCYSLIHTGLVLPVLPFQNIEMFCGYLVMLCILIMHNRICSVPSLISRISTIAAIIVCMVIFTVNVIPIHFVVIRYFSAMLTIIKLTAGEYLIVTGIFFMPQVKRDSIPIYIASIFYGTSCLWDRFLPMFEPIFTNWFMEWGALMMIVALDIVMVGKLFDSYVYKLSYIEEQRQMSKQLAMQRDYSARIRLHSDENRRLIHDFRQHIRVIEGMAKSGESSLISEYLGNVNLELNSVPRMADVDFCENSAADALLRYYASSTQNKDIDFKCNVVIPKSGSVPDTELCSVIGNLIENAMEACERQKSGHRGITFTCRYSDRELNMVVKNTYNGKLKRNDDGLLSQKRQNRKGIGLTSIYRIVDSRNGSIRISTANGVFIVTITLPY